MASRANEEVDQIDLAALDYALAISKIDTNVGRLEAKHVSWPKDGELTETAIDLVDCIELLPTPGEQTRGYILNESFNPYLYMRQPSEYYCLDASSLLVQGSESTEQYKYIDIRLLGCDLGESDCPDVADTEVDVITLKSHVDMGADPDEVVSYTMTSEKILLDPSAS